MSHRRFGISIVEILVVLAILGVLLSFGVASLRAPDHVAAANAARGFLQDGRVEAVKRNRAVVITYDATGRTFVMSAQASSGNASCATGLTQIGAFDLDTDYGGVTANVALAGGGLVWLPSGTVRSCTVGTAAGATVVMQGRTGTRQVLVSDVGRVEVQ